MDDNSHFRSLRRLLLLWVALIAIWGLMGVSASSSAFWGGTSATLCQRPVLQLSSTVSTSGIIFLALFILHGALLWIGFSGKIPRNMLWLYFLMQGGLVLGASLVFKQINVALNLYLVLILMAIGLLKQVRTALIVVGGYLILMITYA